MADFPNLHPNLKPRTWDLRAETWDLKVFLPQPIIRSPVSLCAGIIPPHPTPFSLITPLIFPP